MQSSGGHGRGQRSVISTKQFCLFIPNEMSEKAQLAQCPFKSLPKSTALSTKDNSLLQKKRWWGVFSGFCACEFLISVAQKC